MTTPAADDDVLDFDRIKAAGIPTDGLGLLRDGVWCAYHPTRTTLSVSFGWDGEDVEGQAWWAGTTYTDGEPADTFSYTSLGELLDHVARVVRR